LFQLVYISSARQSFCETDLGALLAAARRNNRHVGVTGLLLCGGRRFLQALEGPEKSVQFIFDKIRADERHRAIVELARRTVDAREFGDWDMAFEPAGGIGGGLQAEVERLVGTLNDPNLRAQFTGFAALHGKAA
jgi:hypothetical protein